MCHHVSVLLLLFNTIVAARENALAKSGKPYAIALHSFRGGQPGDLPLVKGELIELTGSVGSDWLRGKAGDKQGIFPGRLIEQKAKSISVNIYKYKYVPTMLSIS